MSKSISRGRIISAKRALINKAINVPVWQYGLWSFQTGDTKLEIFLPENQHTLRKLLNFEFWINDKLSKIGYHFSNKVI